MVGLGKLYYMKPPYLWLRAPLTNGCAKPSSCPYWRHLTKFSERDCHVRKSTEKSDDGARCCFRSEIKCTWLVVTSDSILLNDNIEYNYIIKVNYYYLPSSPK